MLKQLVRAAGVALLFCLCAPAVSQTPSKPASEWISALHSGGYMLVLRHEDATNPDQADTDPLNIKDVSKQRQLSDQGRALAKSIGESMHKLKIPVGQVRTSMFNRAIETGTLLGFGDVSPSFDYTEGGLVVSPKRRMIAGRRHCGPQ